MRLLHTSDWHIGRTFHGHDTLPALRGVLRSLADVVADERVDAVLVAGDVFDSATPSADAFALFDDAVADLRAAGAVVIMTSGNHDSVARLGHQARFAAFGGVHVRTRHAVLDEAVVLQDADGPVEVFGIPYLEPLLVRHAYPDAELRTHEQALTHAMDRVRRAAMDPEVRAVVLAHCFASAGQPLEAAGGERDLSQGGVDVVPAAVFAGVAYAGLGHIHSRARLDEGIRYSGAPLHYSFGETSPRRGGWLVELDAHGLAGVEWRDLPVPRALTTLEGTLDSLLTDPAHSGAEGSWVHAVLTDPVRQQDSMTRLQRRFPFAARLEHRPEGGPERIEVGYAERTAGQDDTALLAGFLEHVRAGSGPSDDERAVLAEALAAVTAAELVR